MESLNPLVLRIVTGVVLIGIALGAVWQGGTVYSALVAAATLMMFSEWAVMQRLPRGVRLAGLLLLAGVILLMSLASVGEAVVALAGGAGLIGLFARRLQKSWGFWTAAGVLYCGLPAISLIWLRDLRLGLAATVFVLVAVWATDIVAFFAGKAIGGPKMAPSISPKKTWAGGIGGVLGAALGGFVLAGVYLPADGGRWPVVFGMIAGGLGILAIFGDLFESWLKRRAGVKDSGNVLPGHGGVMDRLDGLVPAAIAGAAVFAFTGWAG